jgi:hypothetical protein
MVSLESGLILSFIAYRVPGPGDRMRFDETAVVSLQGENVCFNVNDAQDYKPVAIAIN